MERPVKVPERPRFVKSFPLGEMAGAGQRRWGGGGNAREGGNGGKKNPDLCPCAGPPA